MGESPPCGSQSHTESTRLWFPDLTALVGRGQGAPSSTGPFWKHACWCLNEHLQGWVEMALVTVSFFSVPPPLTSPLALNSILQSLYPENLFVSLKFISGIFVCDVVLSVQLLLQASIDIVGMVEHFSLQCKHSPYCLRLQHWIT